MGGFNGVRTPLLVSTLACVACTVVGTNTRAIFHNVAIGNDGNGVVENVTVQYGSMVLPGTVHPSFAPAHRSTHSEGMYIPVPETATIRWMSADGKGHRVAAPMRSFVDKPGRLAGFDIRFVDDHVDIYRIDKKDDFSTKNLATVRERVFSSGT